MKGNWLCELPLAFCVLIFFDSEALAYGALAMGGNPLNVSTGGIAVGAAVNSMTPDAAATTALQKCRTEPNSSLGSKALCKVTTTFRHEWLSIAIDPAPRMSGFGWSIDQDRAGAERNALTQCRVTAPPERSQFCVVGVSKHDDTP